MNLGDVTGNAERRHFFPVELPICSNHRTTFLVEIFIAVGDAVAALVQGNAFTVVAAEFIVMALWGNSLLAVFAW